MKPKFELTINAVEIVNQLPGSWPESDCLSLLKRLEFEGAEDLPKDQLNDYATMALQDFEPNEAAEALIEMLVGEKLSAGKRQNLCEDMTSERQWEEYPDLSYHEPIFNAQVLLNQAFSDTPTPEIHRVEATLDALNQAAEQILIDLKDNLPEAIIVRCLAAATPEDSILNRLFEDQIEGGDFPEAENIAWQIVTETLAPAGSRRQRRKLSLYSPIRWTSGLEEDQAVECEPFIEKSDD